MQEHTAGSFTELHDTLSEYRRSNLWVFRGHAHPDWRLTPKAARSDHGHATDRGYFDAWKRLAHQFTEVAPVDEWDWLAVAQHHGLATRLLDWTYNPLVAAFFASEVPLDAPGVIYAFHSSTFIDTRKTQPFDVTGVGVVRPRGVAQRIVRQGGIFTIHGPPAWDLLDKQNTGDTLERIVITPEYRRLLPFELSQYGIHRMSLFPDLDGLSQHVNWYWRNRGYWIPEKVDVDVPPSAS